MIVTIEVVDTDAAYGFFGKVVCKSDVRGLSNAALKVESDLLSKLYPWCSLRYVEEVPAVQDKS